MTYVMSPDERQAFLAGVHVGILSVAEPGRGPLTVPVWYEYEPGGDIQFTTGGGSKKARLLRQFGRCSMCVQTETSPYQYVSVEGPVVRMEPADPNVDLRRIARRYLGLAEGDEYIREYQPAEDILVVVRPERWYSADYSKEG
jgi:PPOX class probable F420-dependent enzyme